MLNYPKPREGTETCQLQSQVRAQAQGKLNYPKPREGTETVFRPSRVPKSLMVLNYPKPREGTETC